MDYHIKCLIIFLFSYIYKYYSSFNIFIYRLYRINVKCISSNNARFFCTRLNSIFFAFKALAL